QCGDREHAECEDRNGNHDLDQADAAFMAGSRECHQGLPGAAQAPPPSKLLTVTRLPEAIATSRAFSAGRLVAMHTRTTASSSPGPGPPPPGPSRARPSGPDTNGPPEAPPPRPGVA